MPAFPSIGPKVFVGKKCHTVHWDTYSKRNALWFHITNENAHHSCSGKFHNSRGELAKTLLGRKAHSRIFLHGLHALSTCCIPVTEEDYALPGR